MALTRGNVVFNGSSTPKYIREMLAAVSEVACVKEDNLSPTRKMTREVTPKKLPFKNEHDQKRS